MKNALFLLSTLLLTATLAAQPAPYFHPEKHGAAGDLREQRWVDSVFMQRPLGEGGTTPPGREPPPATGSAKSP